MNSFRLPDALNCRCGRLPGVLWYQWDAIGLCRHDRVKIRHFEDQFRGSTLNVHTVPNVGTSGGSTCGRFGEEQPKHRRRDVDHEVARPMPPAARPETRSSDRVQGKPNFSNAPNRSLRQRGLRVAREFRSRLLAKVLFAIWSIRRWAATHPLCTVYRTYVRSAGKPA